MMSWSDVMSHLEGILLVVMCVIFIGITAWAYSPGMRKRMDDSAQIPLRDDH
jgi:cbb3-type cytochrome oxidase subunit 3